MADFRLITVSIILSVFSIASNSLLVKKREHLNNQEFNFAVVSLVGSLMILMASIYFGKKSSSVGVAKSAVLNNNAAGSK